MCLEIGAQFRLCREQTINGGRGERLWGCVDTALFGKVLSDPLGGGG